MESSKKYHPSEISLHTSKEDCWLVIHGKVYDVTAFLEDHPGGDDVLIQAAGTGDATDAFEEVGHSSTATSMMEGYFIGVVEGKLGTGGLKAAEGASAEGSLKSRTMQERKASTSSSASFMDYLLPLLVLAVAFGAWYYLTYFNAKA